MASSLEIAAGAFASKIRSSRSTYSGIDSEKHWREGDLSYKFWDVQKRMAAVLTSGRSLKKVLNCSRRIRKTTTALIKCIEDLNTNEGPPIRFVAPTQLMLRKIVHPIIKIICQDCPEDMKPVWKGQDGYYFFPKLATELHISGSNNGHEDDSRGQAARRCVVDEAQKVNKLKYVVEDVLMPQLLSTHGDLWMLFTPPKTPIHESVQYAQEAKMRNDGSYAEFNIYQSEYEPGIIEEYCHEAGGKDSTTWLREYMCQFVVDTNFSIVPEFKDEFVQTYVPDEFYKFYFKYVGMDIGARDKTAAIFGTYDFKKVKLFIQGEDTWTGPQMTTKVVADGITAKEKELWDTLKPQLRISDNNNLILLQDLSLLHGIHFSPTSKDTLEAMVNELRLWVGQGRIIIDPRCSQLVGCLKYGVWNDRRTEWERSTLYGHFDALAALMYLVRYVDKVTNPIPKLYGVNDENSFINPNEKELLSKSAKSIRKALGVKKIK